VLLRFSCRVTLFLSQFHFITKSYYSWCAFVPLRIYGTCEGPSELPLKCRFQFVWVFLDSCKICKSYRMGRLFCHQCVSATTPYWPQITYCQCTPPGRGPWRRFRTCDTFGVSTTKQGIYSLAIFPKHALRPYLWCVVTCEFWTDTGDYRGGDTWKMVTVFPRKWGAFRDHLKRHQFHDYVLESKWCFGISAVFWDRRRGCWSDECACRDDNLGPNDTGTCLARDCASLGYDQRVRWLNSCWPITYKFWISFLDWYASLESRIGL
jgi:hypothetical protein